jgi:hypothetical protein
MVPGYRVSVHAPDDGKFVRRTLPEGKIQVGGVIAPAEGGSGVTGCSLITKLWESEETHPAAFVTIYV